MNKFDNTNAEILFELMDIRCDYDEDPKPWDDLRRFVKENIFARSSTLRKYLNYGDGVFISYFSSSQYPSDKYRCLWVDLEFESFGDPIFFNVILCREENIVECKLHDMYGESPKFHDDEEKNKEIQKEIAVTLDELERMLNLKRQ